MAWWAWADTVSPHNATVVAHTAALRQHRIDVLETLGHPQDPITTQAHACVSEQGLIQHMRPGYRLVGISFPSAAGTTNVPVLRGLPQYIMVLSISGLKILVFISSQLILQFKILILGDIGWESIDANPYHCHIHGKTQRQS